MIRLDHPEHRLSRQDEGQTEPPELEELLVHRRRRLLITCPQWLGIAGIVGGGRLTGQVIELAVRLEPLGKRDFHSCCEAQHLITLGILGTKHLTHPLLIQAVLEQELEALLRHAKIVVAVGPQQGLVIRDRLRGDLEPITPRPCLLLRKILIKRRVGSHRQLTNRLRTYLLPKVHLHSGHDLLDLLLRTRRQLFAHADPFLHCRRAKRVGRHHISRSLILSRPRRRTLHPLPPPAHRS